MVQIPEPLVQMREHRQRYTRLRRSIRDRRAWHDPNATSLLPPTLELYRAYWRLVREEPLPGRERLRCAATLLCWWFVNWHAFRVAAETLDLLVPGTVYRAERLKTRLFGAAPGHLVEEAERR
ncbi:MAG: hypothetical protein RMK73_00695 [Geminicoccaceae bacterium]|nr:hypothetical protein [Geminicoccaceae bacterium]